MIYCPENGGNLVVRAHSSFAVASQLSAVVSIESVNGVLSVYLNSVLAVSSSLAETVMGPITLGYNSVQGGQGLCQFIGLAKVKRSADERNSQVKKIMQRYGIV